MNLSKRHALIPAVTAGGALLLFILAGSALRSRAGVRVGERVPGATLRSASGSETNTNSWRGSPTVLIIFQSGCGACMKQIASLASIAPRLPELRIALLSLNGEPLGGEPGFDVYFDPEGRFIRRMRRLRVPALYWIGADGKVKYARTGCRPAPSDLALFQTLLTGESMVHPQTNAR